MGVKAVDVLDDAEYRERLDSQNMLRPIRELPMQIQCAWQQVHESVELPTSRPTNVVILGMGGSAIGGDIARSLIAEHSPIPIIVHRDYGVPACVGEHSLVIAVSYSGNTEETLSGFDAAVERSAQVFAIAAGGELINRASKCKVPYYKFNYETQPRAALGYLLTPILAVFNSTGIYSIDDSLISEVVQRMREEQVHWDADTAVESNPAKQLAHMLVGYIPVVCASSPLTVVARRWKTQLNENANCACFFEELPELCHNMVEGLGYPRALGDRIFVLMLRSQFAHERNRLREEIVLDLLGYSNIPHRTITMPNATHPLIEVLHAIMLGDYVSYYLALLHRVEPTEIINIDYLKARLQQGGQFQQAVQISM